MKDKYRVAIIVILLAAGLVTLCRLDDNPGDSGPVDRQMAVVGKPLPDFSFPDLSGGKVGLSDHRGKVVLVHVWATWCPPCVAEMPSMEALYQKLPKDSFEILAVSIDAQGRDAVAPFIERNRLTFPALLDPDGAISLPYGITGVPESFIADKDGMLVRKIIGPISWTSTAAFELLHGLIQQPASSDSYPAGPVGR